MSEGAKKLISPKGLLTNLQIFAELPEALIANFVFFNRKHSYLEYVDKFSETFIEK